jgi:hypothetical protein
MLFHRFAVGGTTLVSLAGYGVLGAPITMVEATELSLTAPPAPH